MVDRLRALGFHSCVVLWYIRPTKWSQSSHQLQGTLDINNWLLGGSEPENLRLSDFRSSLTNTSEVSPRTGRTSSEHPADEVLPVQGETSLVLVSDDLKSLSLSRRCSELDPPNSPFINIYSTFHKYFDCDIEFPMNRLIEIDQCRCRQGVERVTWHHQNIFICKY